MSTLIIVPPVVDQRPPATQNQPLLLQKSSSTICTVPIVDQILQEPGVSPSSSSNINTVRRPQPSSLLNDGENKTSIQKRPGYALNRKQRQRIKNRQNRALGRKAKYSLANTYGAPCVFAGDYIRRGVIEKNEMNITRVAADDVIESNETSMAPVTTTHVAADDVTEQNEINMVPIIITISLPECSLLDDECIF